MQISAPFHQKSEQRHFKLAKYLPKLRRNVILEEIRTFKVPNIFLYSWAIYMTYIPLQISCRVPLSTFFFVEFFFYLL